MFCSFSRSFWLELFFVSILYLSLDGIQVPFLSPKLRTFTDDDSLSCMYVHVLRRISFFVRRTSPIEYNS